MLPIALSVMILFRKFRTVYKSGRKTTATIWASNSSRERGSEKSVLYDLVVGPSMKEKFVVERYPTMAQALL